MLGAERADRRSVAVSGQKKRPLDTQPDGGGHSRCADE